MNEKSSPYDNLDLDISKMPLMQDQKFNAADNEMKRFGHEQVSLNKFRHIGYGVATEPIPENRNGYFFSHHYDEFEKYLADNNLKF